MKQTNILAHSFTEIYDKTHIVSICINKYEGTIEKSFSIVLRDLNLDNETISKIKLLIGDNNTVDHEYIEYNDDVLNGNLDTEDINITQLIKSIFQILYQSDFIHNNENIGFTYNYDDKIYSSYDTINVMIAQYVCAL